MSELSLEVGIVSRNAAALAEFYCYAFDFEVVKVLEFPQGRVHRLAKTPAAIKIFQPVDLPAPADLSVEWNQSAGFRYAALHVDDAAITVERALMAGAALLTEVTNHRPGAWFALIADPDGNVMEILQEEELA